MRISFLTSGHLPYDDRIFWHMAITLHSAGHEVEIISSMLPLKETSKGILVDCFDGNSLTKKNKIRQFIEFLDLFRPDIIICSEPLPVVAGKKYSRRKVRRPTVIYDITEWYPSVRNLEFCKPCLRWFLFLKLLVFNIFASSLADAFIFGEWYKSLPYRIFYPFKRYLYLSYFPDLKYLEVLETEPLKDNLKLTYSGRISIDKGFINFLNVIEKISIINPGLKINLKIIGWFENDTDRKECESMLVSKSNITVSFRGRLSLTDFIAEIKDTHIFLDLRKINFESSRSLPIKLFYYAALGRPVIFSDLKAIRRDVRIDEFGYLVNPSDYEKIANLIVGYTINSGNYINHCRNARRLAEEKYNWSKISPSLKNFIELFHRN